MSCTPSSRFVRAACAVLMALTACGIHLAAPATGVNASKAHDAIQPDGTGVMTPTRVSTRTVPEANLSRIGFGGSGQQAGTTSAPPRSTAMPIGPSATQVSTIPVPNTTNAQSTNGMSDSGYVPDPNGAGGPDNYLEMTNKGFSIYTRGGALQYQTTYNNWFSSTGGSSASYHEPNVIYDQYGQVFIMNIVGNGMLISVGQGTNATASNFCNYQIPKVSGWGYDFDKIGINGSYVYFTSNLVAGPGKVNNVLYRVSRTALENCQPLSYTRWLKLANPDGSVVESLDPAQQDTPSAGGVEFLVDALQYGGCSLTLWTLPNSGTTLSSTSVPTQCYSQPPPSQQLGSSVLLGPGDCSVNHASYINGLLTLDVTSSYNWGDGLGPVGIVQWFVLNPSAATVSSQGAFGAPGYWMLYPSVVRDYNGNLTFVVGASGPNIYPSLWIVRMGSTQGGVATSSQILAQGQGPYSVAGTSPYADYQSVWLDAQSMTPNAVWVTGAYAAPGGNTWMSIFTYLPPAS